MSPRVSKILERSTDAAAAPVLDRGAVVRDRYFDETAKEPDLLRSLAFPAVAEGWPQLRRDAFVACWSVLLDATIEARRAGEDLERDLGSEPATFEDAMARALAHALAAQERGKAWGRPPPTDAVMVMLETERGARAVAGVLARELVPPVCAESRSAWEALSEVADPPVLSSLDRWPVALMPGGTGAGGVQFEIRPALLPDPAEASAWIAALRARTGEHVARVLLARPAWRAPVVRAALDLAAEHASGPAQTLAKGTSAEEHLDAELVRLLGALAPKLREGNAREAFAAFLGAIGAEGTSLAQAAREVGPEWHKLGARLAFAAWCDVVAPRIARRHPPSVPHVIAVDAALSLAESITIEESPDAFGVQLLLRLRTGETRTVRPDHSESASLSPDVAATVRAGLERFSSVLAFRLFVWCVEQAYRIAQDPAFDGRKFAPKREFLGGCAEIAEDLRLTDKGAPGKIREILSAMAFRRWPLPGGKEGNLLGFSEESAEDAKRRPRAPGQATRGRKARAVVLTFLDPLCPFYAGAMARDQGTTLRERTDRKLVPVLPVEPPFVGRDNEHAPQAAFYLRLLCELRLRAPEIASRGGAAFTADALAGIAGPKLRHPIAVAEGKRAPVWIAALDRWTHSETGAAPLLDLVAGKAGADVVIHLGRDYPAERAWLEARGAEELRASAQGKRGAEIKAAERTGQKARGTPRAPRPRKARKPSKTHAAR